MNSCSSVHMCRCSYNAWRQLGSVGGMGGGAKLAAETSGHGLVGRCPTQSVASNAGMGGWAVWATRILSRRGHASAGADWMRGGADAAGMGGSGQLGGLGEPFFIVGPITYIYLCYNITSISKHNKTTSPIRPTPPQKLRRRKASAATRHRPRSRTKNCPLPIIFHPHVKKSLAIGLACCICVRVVTD